MERLTIEYCGGYVPEELCSIDRLGGADDCDLCCEYCKATEEGNEDCSECAIYKCFNKLGEYEELEEQGKLLKLPCKSGDKIYYIVRGGRKDIIKSTKVIQIIIKDSIKIQCEEGVTLKPSQVFSTYEVAEQVLKEKKNY